MEFAQFIVQNVHVDSTLIEKINDGNLKAGDLLVAEKILSKEELIKLLKIYIEQENSTKS